MHSKILLNRYRRRKEIMKYFHMKLLIIIPYDMNQMTESSVPNPTRISVPRQCSQRCIHCLWPLLLLFNRITTVNYQILPSYPSTCITQHIYTSVSNIICFSNSKRMHTFCEYSSLRGRQIWLVYVVVQCNWTLLLLWCSFVMKTDCTYSKLVTRTRSLCRYLYMY